MERDDFMKLEDKLANLSDQPGVYQMLNDRNEIIYVGKARNLRNRVRQYFHAETNQAPKVRAMMQHVHDFHTIVTDSEIEALILECNLIKENRPKYNILLRDDKSYPYIKITLQEKFPRVMKTRNMIKDGSKYYGPYTDAGAVNETLELIRKMYPIRSCNKKIDSVSGRIERPCLNYHISKCLGPCKGDLHHEEYMEMIHQIDLLLQGKGTELKKHLLHKMKKASDLLQFETAATIRNQLEALAKITEKQKMDTGKEQDQDVIAAAIGESEIYVQVFTVRIGKIIQQHNHVMKTNGEAEENQIYSAFLKQFYGSAPSIPKEILLPTETDDKEAVEEWLTERRGNLVAIKVPKKGEKKNLVDLVKKNAAIQLEQREKQRVAKEKNDISLMMELQKLLKLQHPPKRVEAIDISHTSGVESVGALTVFVNGNPRKKDYRKYKIRSVQGPDDTGSITELLTRRLFRAQSEADEVLRKLKDPAKTTGELPDLFLIDGGQAQISAMESVLSVHKTHIPVAGMVKDSKHRTRWLLAKGVRHDLKEMPGLWRLITEIQDETHRFAISYHNQRRNMQLTKSDLIEIPGVGNVRRRHLMAYFKTIDRLKQASWEEIKEIPGFSETLAKSVESYFKKSHTPD